MDLNKSDRKALFTLRAEKIGVDPVIIEKDFWVVFTLHHLFSSKIPVGFVFKGGTSLSKCYNCHTSPHMVTKSKICQSTWGI